MPIGDLLAQITGEPSPTSTDTKMSFPPKRKLEEQIRRPADKLQKTGVSSTNSPRPLGQIQKSSTVDAPMAKMKLGTNGSKGSPSNATSSIKNVQPRPPPNPGPPKAPPKKGSFAEIMARGKVAQATLGQVGKIQHKKIEKLPSKREREEMMAQKTTKLQKNLGPNGKFRAAGQEVIRDARNAKSAREGNGKPAKKTAEPVPEKKIKKAALATTGYAGTARPKPGGAKGPSKSSSSSSSRYDRGSDRYRDDRRGNSGARYAYISEDEEEEEDEDEEEELDYDSESDMEAAAFEVDEEEELAARIARREDAQALAEENRLKREKEEKRRRLAALAKSRR